MEVTFCQKCLAPNAVSSAQCTHCGGRLILPTIPAYLEGDVGEFFEEEILSRIEGLERQVNQLTGKLREVLKINRHLAQGLYTSSFKASLLTGYFLKNQGRIQEAERCFHRSVHLYNQSLSANVFLGILALERNRWAQAAGFFEKGLAIESSAFLQYMLAVAHYMAGRLGKAYGVLEKALTADPYFSQAYLLMANIAYKRGWKKKSWECLKRLVPNQKVSTEWPASDRGMLELFHRQDENLLPQLIQDQSLVRYLLREIAEASGQPERNEHE